MNNHNDFVVEKDQCCSGKRKFEEMNETCDISEDDDSSDNKAHEKVNLTSTNTEFQKITSIFSLEEFICEADLF